MAKTSCSPASPELRRRVQRLVDSMGAAGLTEALECSQGTLQRVLAGFAVGAMTRGFFETRVARLESDNGTTRNRG